MTRSTDELRTALQPTDPVAPLTEADLATIQSDGAKLARRRASSVLAAGMAMVAVLAVGATAVRWIENGDMSAVLGSSSHSSEVAPEELMERVLNEIPGSERLSSSQVSVPAPKAASGYVTSLEDGSVGDPVAVPMRAFAPIADWEPQSWPAWLWEGEASIQREPEARPTVLADPGPGYLSCISPPDDSEAGCYLSLLHLAGDQYVSVVGFGSPLFQKAEEPMEVFVLDNLATGSPTWFTLGGASGEVSRAVFIGKDGLRVEGTVDYDNLTPGNSVFWADLAARPARVVTYGVSGEILEDHVIEPCDPGIDCEVR